VAGCAVMGGLASACEQQAWVSGFIGRGTNARLTAAQITAAQMSNSPAERAAAHLLRRLTYGPRPGEIARVTETGVEAFIEQQLAPESITDPQAWWLARRIETLSLKAPDIFNLSAEETISDLRRATLLRALYSERQLLEVMVEFWSDHFNIFAGKADCAWLKVIDDREVIRPHALGRFRDLLRASATSPAMLVYLDGRASHRGNPNENYARELLELHTLGVDGGYTQNDVRELARALTGWQVRNHFWRGRVHFEQAAHDEGSVSALGSRFAVNHEHDLDRVIDLVSGHPSTAHFISTKLCRRFVSDDPPTSLITQVATRFSQSDGDIRETLRTLFRAPEFLNAPPKFKRPYTFAVSALRALGAASNGGEQLQDHLRALGQLPFNWPTPDGYPEGEEHWRAQLLARWNFAFDLTGGHIKGTSVDLSEAENSPALFAAVLLQRALTSNESAAISQADDRREAIALLLCAPDFQYQ
jgi:uncharacterized protein (DUF1800 family)